MKAAPPSCSSLLLTRPSKCADASTYYLANDATDADESCWVKQTTVLVAGATGFIASHAIQQLLEKTPYHVHGTVRSLQKPDTFAHLTALSDTSSKPTCWTLTCGQDLVEPAERGTENVIRGAIREASVAGNVYFTEEDRNTRSNLHRNPYYYYSKVCGEKKAWKLLKDVPHKRLVEFYSFLVVGPSMTYAINESIVTFIHVLNGELPAMADLWGIVDVRDVANAHILALTNPRAHGRRILTSQVLSMHDAARTAPPVEAAQVDRA
ncbi:hypothetical protein H310_13922 [Aphanomyces invadans]|uniref:NAD-dependent epimerase/dehydratase domain-containing protein n=1 Tax=Aphanomyces invadans TaxID=157072 RepID=A0A024TBK4_9STRA|nr:hypothetical protein H310_13922 [Aphanomyces invadans]ETV91540.1 hypothetical protein H310_13922 [Aphanomyces invadans]|eukprot:XP_008879808.1 hypothetical protein H310_13922 [Aphanomyces invadans]